MSNRRLRVFLAGTSFKLSYGGPAISVASLARGLAGAGVEVGVWAPDQSATNAFPEKELGIRPLAGTAREALSVFGPATIIHDNGIWWRHNHMLSRHARELQIPRVVSTRGMLEPWAFRHKAWKKKLAWELYQERDLRLAALHHATSEQEADNLRHFHLGVPVTMIPNGIEIPGWQEICSLQSDRGSRGNKIALFLGRLYPIKGLPMLIDAWARVRPIHWNLVIAGPDEAGHRVEIEAAVQRHGLAEQVRFPGAIAPQDRLSLYAAADLFISPSYSESFGMAVGEALACGLPVITTTGTPWSQLTALGCGWWVKATSEALAEALREATSSDSLTLREMGAKGRDYVASEFGWSSVGRRMLEHYRKAIIEAVEPGIVPAEVQF